MAEQAKQQQDPKQLLSNRCGERVVEARIGHAHVIFASNKNLVTKKAPGLAGTGHHVDAMALHPAGLMVAVGGERYIVEIGPEGYAKLAKDGE